MSSEEMHEGSTSPSTTTAVPVYQRYMNPILKAVRDLGGSGTIAAIDERVTRDLKLSEEVMGVPHDPAVPDGQSEVEYRMAWARSYLKAAGLVTNASRGLWQLTEEGATTGEVDEYALSADVAGRSRQSSDRQGDAEPELVPGLLERLRARHQALEARGELLTRERQRQCYDNFRGRFGPEILSGIQGEQLLLKMHGRGSKDKDHITGWLAVWILRQATACKWSNRPSCGLGWRTWRGRWPRRTNRAWLGLQACIERNNQ
jgi:hypothetical protein